jgi:hypothetical protein
MQALLNSEPEVIFFKMNRYDWEVVNVESLITEQRHILLQILDGV